MLCLLGGGSGLLTAGPGTSMVGLVDPSAVEGYSIYGACWPLILLFELRFRR